MEPIHGLLSRENWIAGLSEPVRDDLLRDAATIDVAAGEGVGRAGAPCPGVYQVVAGYLKLVSHHEDGRQILISIYSTGNVFAETTVVARRPFNHTTTAMTAARVRLIPADGFWEAYHRHREISDALCFKFAAAIGRQLAGREQRAGYRLGKRIALMLENLCEHCGERFLDGSVLLPIPLTQSDVAEHFDVTRQSVQREMAEMKDAGVIARQGDLWLIRDRVNLAAWA